MNAPQRMASRLRARVWPCLLLILRGAVLASMCVYMSAAYAQPGKKDAAYPANPMRIVVPFTAGGSADIFARVIGAKMSEAWSQQVVIDNRAGSGGVIGTEIAAKATPDGYTLMMGITANIAINPALYKKLPYDPVRDFVPVTLVASAPYVLVVSPTFPARTAQEFLALARAKPGELNYASMGNGSAGHLTAELLAAMAGVKFVHVPYKAIGIVMTDLGSGQVQFHFLGMVSAQAQLKGGTLRALAVTGAKRSAMMADLPTLAEAGVPGYEVTGWYGVFAPAGTPRGIVLRLNAEIARILALPDVRQRLSAEGAELMVSTPDEFAAFIKREIAKWVKAVKISGATAD